MPDVKSWESLNQTYKVKCSGNPQPKAEWTVDGKEIKPESGRVTLEQNGDEYTLKFTPLKEKDAGAIQCKLSNVLGAQVVNAKLEILRKYKFLIIFLFWMTLLFFLAERDLRIPIIKQGLVDRSFPKGEAVNRQVILTADPVPDITW